MGNIKIYPTKDLSKEIILYNLNADINYESRFKEENFEDIFINGKKCKLLCTIRITDKVKIPRNIKYKNIWYSLNAVEPNIYVDIENDDTLKYFTDFCTNPISQKRKMILKNNL
jgi:hypothetical protein